MWETVAAAVLVVFAVLICAASFLANIIRRGSR